MIDIALPIAYALLFWWFSTGALLYLDGLPRRSHRWSLLGAGLLALPAVYGLHVASAATGVANAYLAFTCALLVWAWVEMSFLMGFITGPRRTPCPSEARGWQRFSLAVGVIWHHELLLIACLGLIVAVSWGGENQLGAWTFLGLWLMRLSTKLNVFLGARNLNESWLPEHLAYLESYFTRRRMNALFPVSLALSLGITWLVFRAAFAADATAAESTGLLLLGSLLALGVVEHLFLMLPVSLDAIFRWGFRSRAAADERVS